MLSVSQGVDGELYAMFANGDIKLLAPSPLAGDYNGNGIVDAADYTIWRNAFGQSISLPNETESLGMVDEDDYNAWKGNFGATRVGGGSAESVRSAGVPEPTSLVMWLAYGLGPLAMRRRVDGGRPS